MPDSETGVAGVVPRVKALFGRSGIQIHDPIEDVTAALETDSSVDPQPADPNGFVYPVDTAVTFETTAITTPRAKGIWVRDADGDIVAEVSPQGEYQSFPADTYFIEFSSFAMKIYGRVDASFDIIPRDDEMQLLFDPDTPVTVGVRSLHKQPARTITTTRSPEGLMEAISLFGHSMKTWSPERTYPTLRGHPPLVEFGETSAYDNGHTPPDTGIEIRVPAAYEWVYPVTPLCHWLGATVQPGDAPVLAVSGSTYPLGAKAGYEARSARLAFEHHVSDILRYTFLVETAMRRTYDRHSPPRERVEAADLGLDLDGLYAEPLAVRVDRYLEALPFPDVEAVLEPPTWNLTMDVEPTAEQGPITPFMARDLAEVRAMPDGRIEQAASAGADAGVSPFSDGGSVGGPLPDGGDAVTRSSHESVPQTGGEQLVRSLPESTSLNHAWAGAGFAQGAATVSTASYLQRLENLAAEKHQIQVEVVVNDENMLGEEAVLDVYGSRENLDFGVTHHEQLTCEELAAVLESETDFVHYVVHVDPEGFRCQDGHLDAASLDQVAVDMFVLNACASKQQGQQLVEKGAIAGVVTMKEVISSAATVIGKRFAELLNSGFPISAATNLIRETKLLAQQYSMVGDTNATLAQPTGGTTVVEKVERDESGRFVVESTVFASWNLDSGSILHPHYAEQPIPVPAQWGPVSVGDEELAEALDRWVFPIVAGGEFYWSDEVTVARLREELSS